MMTNEVESLNLIPTNRENNGINSPISILL